MPSCSRHDQFVLHAPTTQTVQSLLKLSDSGTGHLVRFAEQLRERLSGWQAHGPEPEEPARAAPAARQAPSGNLAEDPWVVQTVAQWKYMEASGGPQSEDSLLGMALGPFYLGGSVTAAQALEFFRQARPDFSRKALLDQIRVMKMGFSDNPAISAFLEDLERELKG